MRTPGISTLLLLVVAALGGTAVSGRAAPRRAAEPVVLPAARAVGVTLDTLFVGGYASGSFAEAMRALASDLSPEERSLVGRHLDRIFLGEMGAGLGRVGRLRVAYERALRPDGSTRSIRVLAAEAAAGGALHRAYYFEREGRPGFYDPFGRSLDPGAWAGPLAELRVTSPFRAARPHPILGRVLPHAGVDYGAPAGTQVRATGDGVVRAAGRRGGYGNLVEVQHPSGYSTRYAHLSRIAEGVAAGRPVRQGEVIGYVGMTGLATGPHLHYEVRRNGQAVDPQRVAAGPGAAADVGGDPGWAGARGALQGLLGRTPTMAREGSGGA